MIQIVDSREEQFVDKKMAEIERRLARVSGYDRHGKPMYDRHLIESDTSLFWSLNISKKSGIYRAQVTIKFPEEEAFSVEAASLEALMGEVEQRMIGHENDFKEWLIFMSK